MPSYALGPTPINQATTSRGPAGISLILDGSLDWTVQLTRGVEGISIDRPSRQSITQTLAGAYQDHLGEGLISVAINGTTGWRGSSGLADGYAVAMKLRDILIEYDRRVATRNPKDVVLMLLLNMPDNWEVFRVSKTSAKVLRSRSQPLLFRYELQFTVLKDSLHAYVNPSPNFVVNLARQVTLAANAPLPDSSTTDQPKPLTGPQGGNAPPEGFVHIGNHNVRLEDEEPSVTGMQVDTLAGMDSGNDVWTGQYPESSGTTLGNLANSYYPSAFGYPPAAEMTHYIIDANVSSLSGVNPLIGAVPGSAGLNYAMPLGIPIYIPRMPIATAIGGANAIRQARVTGHWSGFSDIPGEALDGLGRLTHDITTKLFSGWLLQ